jgi:hypothetical protein
MINSPFLPRKLVKKESQGHGQSQNSGCPKKLSKNQEKIVFQVFF